MNVRELLDAVKDEKLSLNDLEQLRDELIHVHTSMQLELADIEKAEAMYFYDNMKPDVSDISIKRTWRVIPKGQRQIELNRWIKAVVKETDSLKNRIFAAIR